MFLLQVWIGARLDDAVTVVFLPVTVQVTGCRRATAIRQNLTASAVHIDPAGLLCGHVLGRLEPLILRPGK